MRLSSILGKSNRREFLKKTGTGLAAASGLPGMLTVSGNKPSDIFSNMSDEELKDTPESEWIDKVPFARVVRIVNDENYLGCELITKLVKGVEYGIDYRNSGKVAQILNKAAKAGNNDVLNNRFSEIFGYFLENAEEPEIAYEQVGKVARLAKKLGINLPYGEMKQIGDEAAERLKRAEQSRQREIEKNKPETYSPRNDDYIYGSSMH